MQAGSAWTGRSGPAGSGGGPMSGGRAIVRNSNPRAQPPDHWAIGRPRPLANALNSIRVADSNGIRPVGGLAVSGARARAWGLLDRTGWCPGVPGPGPLGRAGRVGPRGPGSGRVRPGRAGSGRSGRVTPVRAGSRRFGPGHAGSGRVTPGRAGSGRSGRVRSGRGQPTPSLSLRPTPSPSPRPRRSVRPTQPHRPRRRTGPRRAPHHGRRGAGAPDRRFRVDAG